MTNKQTKTVEGTVKSLRQDRQGVQLEGFGWFSNKFKAPVTCNRGDIVKVVYTENGEYKNYETVEVLTASTKTVEPFREAREDKTTAMLVSYVKDIYIALIQANRPADEKTALFVALNVASWYKQIREELNGQSDAERPNNTEGT